MNRNYHLQLGLCGCLLIVVGSISFADDGDPSPRPQLPAQATDRVTPATDSGIPAADDPFSPANPPSATVQHPTANQNETRAKDAGPDIAGTWLVGDVGYLKRVIRPLEDGSGDFELLAPPGAGRKGTNLRLKWSAKERRFVGERASLDGKRRAITIIEPDGKNLRVTTTFDEESLKEMPERGGERSFPHVERWQRFVSNPAPLPNGKEVPEWEPEIQTLQRRIEALEAAAGHEAASIVQFEIQGEGPEGPLSIAERKAALEKSLQAIFALKLELEQKQLQALKSRLAKLESQIDERRQKRDQIVARRLQELLKHPAPAPAPTNNNGANVNPFRVDLPDGRAVEFIGITPNTRPAKEGWRPDGRPLETKSEWPATVVLFGKDGMTTFPVGGKHPEPAEDAIDVLLRFHRLKGPPSFVFDWPTEVTIFKEWPRRPPYELRVSTRRRAKHSDSAPAERARSSKEWRIGITDEEWGRFVNIGKDRSVPNPIQPSDAFADTYQLVKVVGVQPHPRYDTTVVLRIPPEYTDPSNPLHQFAFEFNAVDSQGDRLLTARKETTTAGEYVYSLLESLPPGRTLSHFEYRLRPYRYWVTFRSVALYPGFATNVTSTVETFEYSADSANRKPPLEFGAEKKHDRLAWQHDSQAIVATGDAPGSPGDQVHRWKLTASGVSHELIGNCPHPYALATSGRTPLIATGTNAGTIGIWDSTARRLTQIIEPSTKPAGAVYAVAISPDDSQFVAFGSDGNIAIFDQQGQRAGQFEAGKDRFLADLKISPDGKKLAGIDGRGLLTIWNFPEGTKIGEWPRDGVSENAVVQWSAAGDRLAVVIDGSITILAPESESEPRTIAAPENVCLMVPKDLLEGRIPGNYLSKNYWPKGVQWVGATALAPDFKSAATVKLDGTVAIWDVETRAIISTEAAPECIRRRETPGQDLTRIAYSPDGAMLAAVQDHGALVLWKLDEHAKAGVKRLDGKPEQFDQSCWLFVGYDMPGCEERAKIRIYSLDENREIGEASEGKGRTWTEIANGDEMRVDNLAPGEYEVSRLRTYPLLKDSSGHVFHATRYLDSRRIRLEKDGKPIPRLDLARPNSAKKLVGKIVGIKEQGLDWAHVFVCVPSATGKESLYLQNDVCFDVAVTDASGQFETQRLAPGRYKLLVAGYKLKDPARITPSDIDFPRYFAEQAIVIEESAEPRDIEMKLAAVADDVPAQPAEEGSAPTKAPEGEERQAAPRNEVVHPQGEIQGQLLDEAGKPVRGAVVACGAFINESGGGGTSDVTDAEGRYRLKVPSPGIYLVFLKELKRDRKLVVAADDGLLVEAGRVTASRLVLSTGRTVTGKVVDVDGNGAGALRVRYYSPASPNSIGGGETVLTNDRGEFEFVAPPGRIQIEVFFAGTSDDIQVSRANATIPAKGEIPPLKLALKIEEVKFGDPIWVERSTPGTKIVRHDHAADVTGVVVDETGAPLAGAKVFRQGSPIVVADKEGKFQMPIEKGSQFVMHAFASGYRVWFGTPTAGDELKIVLEKKDSN